MTKITKAADPRYRSRFLVRGCLQETLLDSAQAGALDGEDIAEGLESPAQSASPVFRLARGLVRWCRLK